MATKTVNAKLLVRTDTAANWESVNPTLQANELAYDKTNKKFKIGDGSTAWNSLSFIESGGSGGGSEQQWTPKTGDLVLTEPEYIYISSSITAFAYYTIAEGRAVAEGMSIKVYKDPSLSTYTFAIFNGSDFEFETSCEQTQYNNVYRVSSMGGYALMPITMTPNDDVYFINELIEDYYTTEEIDEKFENLGITDISGLPNELETIGNQLYNKVDKVSGKGLSTNDFTTALKNKLNGIATGAEVNVQSDWNATSGDAFIKNKPTIPTKVTDLSDASNFATKEDLEGLGGGTSYPLIDLGGASIYEAPLEGSITLENINKIIQAGGFISQIDSDDYGMKKPFIISYITDTDINLEMRIDYFEDGYSEFFGCWIGRETLEYNVTFSTAPIVSQNNFDNMVFKNEYNVFSGKNEFHDTVSLKGALNTKNGVGSYGQVLTSTGNGVRWETPSSSGGGSTPRTIIYASQNPTAYSVEYVNEPDWDFKQLIITLNQSNSYFKLDLSIIAQNEGIDLNTLNEIRIQSNFENTKATIFTTEPYNYDPIEGEEPREKQLMILNGFGNIFVSNFLNQPNSDEIGIEPLRVFSYWNYTDESGISYAHNYNIYKFIFYIEYDDGGSCHVSDGLYEYEL